MISPRTIIIEACSRINLVPRRQAVPGDILESGYKLLQGIVAKYNNDNLLAWTQNSTVIDNAETIHIYDETDVLEGTPGYNNWEHVHLTNVAKLNSIYIITQNGLLATKLDYVAPADFDKYGPSVKVYTYTQKSEGEWLIQLKPNIARLTEYKIKINYNEGIKFDLDDDLFIPDNYVELLIVAVAHKLALQYPRLDDAQMQRLETEVRVLVDNVRTPKAVDRIIEREEYFEGNTQMTQAELLGGAGIF